MRQAASRSGLRACIPLLALLVIARGQPAPSDRHDDWPTCEPAEVGMSESWLFAARLAARNPGSRINSMLVVKDGRLVLEEYLNGWQRDSLNPLFSVTKSITSILTGTAIENGDLTGLDEPVGNFYPDCPDASRQVTIRHLLSHTTGLEWDEDSAAYGDSANSQTAMAGSDDWAGFVLSRPRAAPPGSVFRYSTGNYFLVGQILERATGVPLIQLARERLFAPLGIGRVDWVRNRQEQVCGGGSGGGLLLRSRDLAKLAQLVLDCGNWQGRQVIGSRWLDSATVAVSKARPGMDYGFGWWSYEASVCDGQLKLVAALGYRSQAVLLVPQERLAIVFTSDYANPRLNLIVAPAACVLISALGCDALPLCIRWLRSI